MLDLESRLHRYGQEHILSGWDRLNEDARRALLRVLNGLDLEELARLYASRDDIRPLPPRQLISPIPIESIEAASPNARRKGEEALAQGEVAIVMVAGGQGSRLGFGKSKGIYPIGPVSEKSLLQIHAEKVFAIGRRYGRAPPLLVMTSGNLSEEPIARENGEAVENLSGIADAFLLHDREIHTRADDSVVRIVAGEAQPLRRSRGFVPEPIRIPVPAAAAPVLGVGAGLKNTVCLTRGDEAFLSPHVGDLGNPGAIAFFEEVVEKLKRLLSVEPAAIAHDLHPDYFSTRWAIASRAPREPVQHHHAHVAACLAEHGRTETAIGIAFDGTGCGPSGELWGGEILTADLIGFRRAGHLRTLRLPGGEAAIRQPWRTAAGALLDAGETLAALDGVEPGRVQAIRKMLEKNLRCPEATGAGRWFDVVAALCGFHGAITYEGQAAAELEASAGADGADGADPYPFELLGGHGDTPFEVDLRPMVREIARARRAGAAVRDVSSRFHETMASVVRESARFVRKISGLETAVFSGGVFQNRTLTERAKQLLEADGFEVLIHRRVPANDGGVALGQAAVAASRLARREGRI